MLATVFVTEAKQKPVCIREVINKIMASICDLNVCHSTRPQEPTHARINLVYEGELLEKESGSLEGAPSKPLDDICPPARKCAELQVLHPQMSS